jgi:hypothetical protein
MRSASVEARVELYLRLLYSGTCAARAEEAHLVGRDAVSDEVAEFLRGIDFARLRIERSARIRNLAHALLTDFSPALRERPKAERVMFAALFADTAAFWEGRGRCLKENYALFLFGSYQKDGRHSWADLVRLEGVLAGLGASHGEPSPWSLIPGLTHERSRSPAGGQRERFFSGWPLLDPAGRLATPEYAARLASMPRGKYRITVEIEPDSSITAECTSC